MKKTKREEWDEAYDAVTAAPDSHIVFYEDDSCRELAVILPPGTKEPLHHHRWPSEFHLLRSVPLRYYDENNKSFDIPEKDVTPENPLIEQLEPEPLHAVENLSESDTYFAIRIEFKNTGR